MTTCTGQPGHPQCSNCVRLRPDGGLMRPVVALTNCALFEPSQAALVARNALGRPSPKKAKAKPRKLALVPYAGAPA